LNGNGWLIKKVGAGIVLRKHSGGTHPVVENADGTNATNIITANGAAQMTGVLQWPNAIGPKIHLYANTFGLGVESGEANIFGSSKVGFRANASNGAYFGWVDANTGGGLIIDRDNCDDRYAPKSPGWVACGLASGISGSAHYKDLGWGYGIKYSVNKLGAQVGDNVHLFNLPAAVPQPFYAQGMNKEGAQTSCKVEGTAVRSMSGAGSLDLWGTFVYPKA